MFATTRQSLGELATFLSDAGVETVAMEATGVYWNSPFYALAGLFPELWLCNAMHVKNVPGRKTDLSDAEWLADVAAHEMVRPSLVLPPEIREFRELTRYRKTQVDARVKEIQRLEKVLQDAGIKLTSVAASVWSVLARDRRGADRRRARPQGLGPMAKGRLCAKIERLEEALDGHFGAHHAIVCRQIIDHLDFLDSSINTLTTELTTGLVPFEAAVAIVTSILGISRTTAEVIVAETGVDMSRFPTPSSSVPGRASLRRATRRRARGAPRALVTAHRGCVAHWSKQPEPPRAPGAPSTRPCTRASLDGGPQQGRGRGGQLHDVHRVASAHQWCALLSLDPPSNTHRWSLSTIE